MIFHYYFFCVIFVIISIYYRRLRTNVHQLWALLSHPYTSTLQQHTTHDELRTHTVCITTLRLLRLVEHKMDEVSSCASLVREMGRMLNLPQHVIFTATHYVFKYFKLFTQPARSEDDVAVRISTRAHFCCC